MKKTTPIRISVMLALCLMLATETINAKQADIKSFKLSDKSITLYINQTKQLSVIKKKPAKASGKIIWKSSDKKVASVSKKGRVKGISEGKAVITARAKSNNSVKAKCKVKVIQFQGGQISGAPDYWECTGCTLTDGEEELPIALPDMMIIENKKDLKKCLSIMKKDNTDLYNKYSCYDDEYFKSNYLVLYKQYLLPGDIVEKIDTQVVQTDSGKIKLCVGINVKYVNAANVMRITIIEDYHFIQSIARNEFNSIDEVGVDVSRIDYNVPPQ